MLANGLTPVIEIEPGSEEDIEAQLTENYPSLRKDLRGRGAIDINRYSVLHGLSMDFNKPINFYRLFIMLVFLAFVSVLLGHRRASSFVAETDLSKFRSDCYDKLAAFGASMKVRFPL
ncbi:hypothetical protein BV326_04000 [Pseudomonas syringae pv. actinidiae]|uniref:hypothetical protein n=1 Tax=Pseudomonas syringae TaxID=317 RepID=UPI000A250B23|nr:hypothetical protein [Pseudomonas syringae]OSR68117.1 hypothetical protein BV326_04000 [Pseudomonas syringae pv. actinidiae]